VLLGLTATPERADGLDVLRHFGGHLSAQIRLPDAINRKLLAPFQYFAVTDTEDLGGLRWQRGGYRAEDLDRVYTGNDLRAALVLEKVRSVLLDPRRARGLGFCVSVAHAAFMARKFNEAGIPPRASRPTPPTASAGRPRPGSATGGSTSCSSSTSTTRGGHPRGRHGAVPAADREPDRLPPAARPRPRMSEDKECLTVLDFVGRRTAASGSTCGTGRC
jgi:hypothetical protein